MLRQQHCTLSSVCGLLKSLIQSGGSVATFKNICVKCLSRMKCLRYAHLAHKRSYHKTCISQSPQDLNGRDHKVPKSLNIDSRAEQKSQNICDDDSVFKDLSEDDRKHLRYIQLEYDLLCESKENVPKEMTAIKWLRLMKCRSEGERQSVLEDFAQAEVNKEIRKADRHMKSLIQEQQQLCSQTDTDNRIVLTPPKHLMNRAAYQRFAHALQYGPHLIVDLECERQWTVGTVSSVVHQIWLSYAINKLSSEPFNIIFCRADLDGQLMKKMEFSTVGNSGDFRHKKLSDYWLTFTEKDCVDLFPREQLVYVTGFASETMTHYDSSATYIIGAGNESPSQRLCHYKAEKLGIKLVRLPIEYQVLQKENWSLPLDVTTAVLLELKRTQDWSKAVEQLKHWEDRRNYLNKRREENKQKG